YEQLAQRRRVNLPAKTTAYRSWAERVALHAQSAGAAAELSYWREVLQKPCVLPIDSGVDAAANTVDSEEQVKVCLSEAQTRALLHDVPAAYHSQINDVLLTALLRSFVRWQLNRGHEATGLLLDLEGHGREEVLPDIDLSRTTGWFTTLFPVYLEVERDVDPGPALKSVKEQLREIPERGLGYGLLRYLNVQTAKELSALPPPLSFNYLGQFDALLSSASSWRLADKPIGPSQSAQRQRGHLLEINGLVAGGQLQLTWSYSQAVHRRESIEELTELFLDELRALIEHCLSPEAGGHTPSDFPFARLTQSQLEHLEHAHPTLEDLYPLSPLQQGLLFHTLYDPSSPMYFEQLCVTLEGRLSPAQFRQAWQKVLDRHPVLRSAVLHEGYETALQMICRDVVLPYHEHDWRGQNESQQQELLTAFLEQDRRQGFELAEPPLMRVVLIRLAEQKYAFVWSHHHLVLDGWSVPIVTREVLEFYRSALTGQAVELAPVRPYREYIGWLQARDVNQAVSFWQERLRGFTEPTLVALPLRRGAKPEQEEVADHELWLAPETTERLQAFAREQRITLNTLVQGAWAMLLSRYAGQADVVFGATVSGRSTDLPGVNEMVGLFINTLPVRVQIEPEAKLSPWLRKLQARHAEEQRYAYCPLVEVQRQSNVPAGQSLFDSLFVFENYPVDESLRESELFADLTITDVRAATRTNYPLALAVIPGRQLALKFWYADQRFENGSIERMAGHLEKLLLGMLSRPDCRLRELPMLTQPEQHKMLVEWNDTRKDYPRDKCIHELFEQQAERSPNAVAVVFGGRQLTYRELNARANRVAHYLLRADRRARAVSPDMLVGIFMDRSLEMVIGLLGVLKAGGAYVPFDSDYPRSRLALMMDDSQVSVLLTQRDLVNSLPDHCARVICLDRDWELIARESEDNPRNSITAEQMAYVIYTSGSTGVPKGVAVSHRAVNRLVLNTDYIRLDSSDKVAQASNASFDAATFEIWGALLNGAQLVGIERDVILSPQQFAACLRQREITTLFLTTSLFNLVARDASDAFRTLRHLLFGGEAVDAQW
ncbi:MAG TPA: condensation domain-containing protein, partial [Blastocatellia bacterium]|nr:condensation domain-containing protein [Blastocatellia bacterium]